MDESYGRNELEISLRASRISAPKSRDVHLTLIVLKPKATASEIPTHVSSTCQESKWRSMSRSGHRIAPLALSVVAAWQILQSNGVNIFSPYCERAVQPGKV